MGPYSNALERENTVVILIDGRIVFRKSIGGAADLSLADRKAGTGRAQVMERFSKIPVQVKAGVHDVVVAFVDRPHVETSENLERLQPYGGLTGGAAPTDRLAHLLDGVAVAGPFNPTGVSMTPSRALIFVCDPKHDRRAGLRQTNHGTPGAPRIPAAGHHGRYEPAHALL